MQNDLFALRDPVLKPALIDDKGGSPFIVIGCGRKKRETSAPADKLYTSRRFKESLRIANQLEAPYAILSGKYGVVAGGTVIHPYDVDLGNMLPSEQEQWAAACLTRISKMAGSRKVVILAHDSYTSTLLKHSSYRSYNKKIITPWVNLTNNEIHAWLIAAKNYVKRIHDIALLYDFIDEKRRYGEIFPLKYLSGRTVPRRGVYVFLDPTEPNYRGSAPRMVRIGTHAVSSGSKATLRGRLRGHLGPSTEIGNHRGSIFRLHVGTAMLARGVLPTLSSWGSGQDASHEVRALEVNHEVSVTRYLGELEVFLIDIDDEPSKNSMRARVEAQLIALCSDGMHTIDTPSTGWLGHSTPTQMIRLSGLWNIRGVGGRYDPNGAGSVASIVGANQ